MAAPVAAELRTKVVAFVTEAMVAPTGMLAPTIFMPAVRPTVLVTVTLAEPFDVAPAAKANVAGAAFGMASSTPPRMSRPRVAVPRRFIVFVVELSRTSLPSWNTITARSELPSVPAPMTFVVPR